MADHQSEHFMPDKIDAQIDASLGGEHTAQYPDPLDWQVIHVLQRHYVPVDDYHQPLERVWNRLAQHRASLRLSQDEEASRRGLQLNSAAQSQGSNPLKLAARNSRSYSTLSSRLSLVAAIVCIVLLIGSTFAVYHFTRPGQGSDGGHATPTNHPTPTNQPTVATDQIYVVVNNTIYRYDATTHRPLWNFSMAVPNNAENIGPRGQVVGDVLYTLGTGSDGYYSYALNTSDGSLRWRFKVHYQSSDLNLLGDQVVSNGKVYLSEVSAFQGYSVVTALDASKGTMLWQHRYDGTGIINLAHPVDDSAGIYLQAASSTTLYGTTFTGTGNTVTTTLYAINASDGSLLWKKKVSTNGGMPDEVGGLVMDGVLCFSTSPHLYGFDAATGEAKWSVPLDGRAYDRFTALQGVVYVATTHDQVRSDYSVYESSGSLYAVRVKDGKQLWRYHALGGVFSPLAQNNMVFVSVSREDGTTPRGIVALDVSSGDIHWTRPVPAGPVAGIAPQVATGKNYLYVNDSDGQIQVWQASDGKSVGAFPVPAPANGALEAVTVLTIIP